MHAVLFGVVAGALLSCLRAPLGLSLIEIPAAEPRHAHGYRALALAVLAAGLHMRGGAPLRWTHFFAAALGLALHGYLLPGPGSHAGLLACAISALALLCWLGSRERRAHENRAASGGEQVRTPRMQLAGWLLGGAGMALGLELLARQLRLHGQQLGDNDTSFALVLVLLLGVGGSAFAWLGERSQQDPSTGQPSGQGSNQGSGLRAGVPMLALAAGALALYGSLSMQLRTASTLPLREYLSSFGLDLSQHGTLPYDALLAASVFVLPAFALGTSLRLLPCGRAQAALVLGGSLGLLLTLKVGDFSAAGNDTQTFAMQWMPLAAALTGAGALVGLLGLSASSSAGRWLQLAFALACMLPIALVEITPRAVLAPWSRTPIAPYQLRETPAGLMTVEGPLLPDSITGNTKQLTLERRVLVPGLEFIPDELAMLDASLALLTPEQQTKREKRALLIGQLTPLRARRLNDAGFAAIDRSAIWWQAMGALEQEYFGEQVRPAGSILAPDDALQAIEAGQYTLVIVPPVRGIAPQLRTPDLPAQTTLVVWLDSATPLRGGSEPGLLHWAPSKIDQPLLARIFGPHAQQACVFSAGPASGSPGLSRLLQREWERDALTRADNFRRVCAAQDSALTRGLEQLYAAQQRSSPFENTAESFELPEPALAELRSAALESSPSPSLRMLWEELGIVLSGKRWIPQLYEALEPLAKRHAPWPGLELQLAIADAESLEFESAAARLRPLRSSFERNPEYWRELGKIQEQLGQAADSVSSFRQALTLRPNDHDLERRLAFQLVRAGDPEGQKLVRELLQEHPDDEELKLFSGSGPYPPPKQGYSPQGRRHDH